MRTAIITSKNSVTGQLENEGEAILLNCLDKQTDRGFYEIRFVGGDDLTHCRWVAYSDIKEEIQ